MHICMVISHYDYYYADESSHALELDTAAHTVDWMYSARPHWNLVAKLLHIVHTWPANMHACKVAGTNYC
jgi:hypothetical protein